MHWEPGQKRWSFILKRDGGRGGGGGGWWTLLFDYRIIGDWEKRALTFHIADSIISKSFYGRIDLVNNLRFERRAHIASFYRR